MQAIVTASPTPGLVYICVPTSAFYIARPNELNVRVYSYAYITRGKQAKVKDARYIIYLPLPTYSLVYILYIK